MIEVDDRPKRKMAITGTSNANVTEINMTSPERHRVGYFWLQTNLTLEAAHLDMFNDNFGGRAWRDCGFPRVVHAVEDVLVSPFVIYVAAQEVCFIILCNTVSLFRAIKLQPLCHQRF